WCPCLESSGARRARPAKPGPGAPPRTGATLDIGMLTSRLACPAAQYRVRLQGEAAFPRVLATQAAWFRLRL
ncbi:MAG: hypothetical protein AVDCRST_MAG08-350, partial [uncultured Acetobacteraceae bacterium]